MQKFKRSRLIFLIILSTIVALLATTFITLSLISPNNYKLYLSKKFKQQTGREIVLSGPISINFFPKIRIYATNIKIPNQEQLSAGNLLINSFLLDKILHLVNIHLPSSVKKSANANIALNLSFNGSKTNLEVRYIKLLLDNTLLSGTSSFKFESIVLDGALTENSTLGPKSLNSQESLTINNIILAGFSTKPLQIRG